MRLSLFCVLALSGLAGPAAAGGPVGGCSSCATGGYAPAAYGRPAVSYPVYNQHHPCSRIKNKYVNPCGWHPFIRRLFGRECGPAPQGPFPGYGAPRGGTLVYPQHPYARSPRDYFMVTDN